MTLIWHLKRGIMLLVSSLIRVRFRDHNLLFAMSFRCCCGQDRTTHTVVPGIDIGVLGDTWLPNKHTRPNPTDAYGTIEFQGSAHPTKAQVRTILVALMKAFSHSTFFAAPGGLYFAVRTSVLRHEARTNSAAVHQGMESRAAQALAHCAGWQGEL